MKTFINCVVLAMLVVWAVPEIAFGTAKSDNSSDFLQVYQVNKRVSEFPDKEDFSTPEAAYAVINRVMASGEQGAWRRISAKRIAGNMPPPDAKREEVKPEYAKMWLNAKILEVRIVKGKRAVVLADLKPDSQESKIDKRLVNLEDGRWLNFGQDPPASSLAEARAQTNGKFARMLPKPSRPRIEDPDSYLKPFVQFLKNKAEDPKRFVMKALAKHKLMIMGETHHRPRYWAFNSSLVADPEFAKHVGTIYMELPSHAQQLVEEFLTAKECDTTPVVEMLRDMLWMGWPDQAMLDFFITVWMVNQNLEPKQRLRIVLVDMERPWKKIKKRQEWAQYERTSRDQQMADNILQDLRKHPDEKRNALFIVGVAHTQLNQEYFKGAPVLTAGWYLREQLGADKVYSIFPHMPVQTNWGRVDGRLCLGLFDSAFAEVDNKPMAFPLDIGPFGKEPFDAFPDRPVNSSYKDGYNAYLYLGPLEYEIFSPLIAGFYTDEFVNELDRRYRVMFKKGLVEGCHLARLDAENFIGWMRSWGKPRHKWRSEMLGPIDAWHYGGSNWKKTIRDEKLAHVMEHPGEIVEAAEQLFDKIRNADYEHILGYYQNGKWKQDGWKKLPASGYYMVGTDWPSFALWICRTFKDNPIVSVELGKVFTGDKKTLGNRGWPTVPYKVTLKDGRTLEGDLPFEYNFDGGKGHWHGMEGIDWHLKYKSNLPKRVNR